MRFGLSGATLALLFSIGAASAQVPAPPTAAAAATSSTVADIEQWTTDQWDAAKAKWSVESAKWAGCEQQATDQKLTGRQSWVFLYKCMF
jgi:hypothetical protein